MSVDVKAATLAWRDGRFAASERPVPEEAAVAVSINGTTHAVMMASPSDLEDMALGLALNERIVRTVDEVERLEMEPVDGGYDCRLWLVPQRAATYVARRRQMTGPVGCGLCGVESLEYATISLPTAGDALTVEPAQIVRAMEEMAEGQVLGRRTRAVHAAAFHRPETGCIVIREDVGRHNALDKLAEACAAEDAPAQDAQERLGVARVQAGGGLVEHVHHPVQAGVQQGRQAQALHLAGRDGGAAASQGEVAQTELQQHVQAREQVAEQQSFGTLAGAATLVGQGVPAAAGEVGQLRQGERCRIGQLLHGLPVGEGLIDAQAGELEPGDVDLGIAGLPAPLPRSRHPPAREQRQLAGHHLGQWERAAGDDAEQTAHGATPSALSPRPRGPSSARPAPARAAGKSWRR